MEVQSNGKFEERDLISILLSTAKHWNRANRKQRPMETFEPDQLSPTDVLDVGHFWSALGQYGCSWYVPCLDRGLLEL